MELLLPNNYVEIEEEEMMYLDGGFALPKMGVSLAVNALFTWATGGVGTLKIILKAFSLNSIKSAVKRYLSGWVRTQVLNRIIGSVFGAIHSVLTLSVGSFVATMWDKMDGKQNGWCSF